MRGYGSLAVVTATLLASAACGQRETNFSTKPGTEDYQDGKPVMEVNAEELWFEEVPVGTARSIDLVITNTGDADLKLFSGDLIANPGYVFYTDDEAANDTVIEPGMEVSIPIGVTLESDAAVEGTYRLDTNDPSQPILDIALLATPEGWVDTGM